jgi:single-strand DNA-binding protein|tara:strand:- start:489 stop:890 length:402 start_codon:yes stop_codon:yes gene_type:complete
MAFDNTLTVIGNVVRDPELQFLGSGVALVKFSIADNQKKADGESEAHFFDCVAWRELGEHIAESFQSGQRVIVHGKLVQSRWETDNGDTRSKVEIRVEDAGHSCRWGTAVFSRSDDNQRSAPRKETVPDHEPF